MKKILILGIVILSIFIIYLKTLDKKIYYLALGDQTSLGMTQEGYYEKSYTEYIKEYLENLNKLEIYINDYQTQGYRITDLINDINNNREIEESNKTLKNSLIKADLITISIGNNDIISKINEKKILTPIDYKNIYKNMSTIINDLDNLLKIIREYSKEEIILTGIYINTNNEKLNEIINYINEKFKETSEKYKITYIDVYKELKANNYKIYPSKEEYKIIGNNIIDEINNNLLKK